MIDELIQKQCEHPRDMLLTQKGGILECAKCNSKWYPEAHLRSSMLKVGEEMKKQLINKTKEMIKKPIKSNKLYFERHKKGNPFDIGRTVAFTDVINSLTDDKN